MRTDENIQRVFKTFPSIQSQRFIMRRPAVEDGKPLYTMAQDEAVSRYVSWCAHRSISESLAVIEQFRRSYDEERSIVWAVESKEEGHFMGLMEVDHIDEQNKSVDIGFWLGTAYWGREYMAEILSSVLAFCCGVMGAVRVQGKVVVDNEPPGRVMLKAGMSYEGMVRKGRIFKDRMWDVDVYAILSEEVLRMPRYSS